MPNRLVFIIAAIVLFVLAAVFLFGLGSITTPVSLGLVAVGFALWCAASLMVP